MTLREAKDQAVVDYLVEVMTASSGNVAMAADMAGVSRQGMYLLLRRYGFESQIDSRLGLK